MADELNDGEFWLPSQFLTDDDILMEKKNVNKVVSTDTEGGFFFPDEFPYGFPSNGSSTLSSPVESVVGSTETESDEENYLAGLTRQMARSMIQEVEKSSYPVLGAGNPKTWVMAGSPQSTLCAVGSCWGYNSESNRGSPNGPSQISSPPSTSTNTKDNAWDVLYAVAGQVARLKMNDGRPKHNHGRGLLGPPQKPTPVPVPAQHSNSGFCLNPPPLSPQQLQANDLYQLKQRRCSAAWGRQGKVAPIVQQNQQHLQNGARPGSFGRDNRSLGLRSPAFSSLQQPQNAGSGMRAVFLGGSGAKRESSGTGVFLPRRVGNPSDSRKKPACSTVLLPARVVQALNLNFDNIEATQQRLGGYVPEHGMPLPPQQRRYIRPIPAMNHEVRLPQEWTY